MPIPKTERFIYYAQTACSHGAFFNAHELLDRFLKTTHSQPLCTRQRKRYLQAIRSHGHLFGLTHFKHLNTFCVKDATSSNHINYDTQYEPWVMPIVQIIKSNSASALEVYKTLKNRLQCSQATLERKVAFLKKFAQKLGIEFFKNGKTLYFRQVEKTPSNTPHQRDIPYYIEAKDINLNSRVRETRFSSTQINSKHTMDKKQTPPIIRKKASILARELKNYFYDNIKVIYNPNMAYRYAEWALLEGFKEDDIKKSFETALIQRHKDATDTGLSGGSPTPSFKYELSSTVSLARTQLVEGLTAGTISKWTPGCQKSYTPKPKRTFTVKVPSRSPAKAEVKKTPSNPMDDVLQIIAKESDLTTAKQYLMNQKTAESKSMLNILSQLSATQYTELRKELEKPQVQDGVGVGVL